jgi:hypothetical protein
VGRFTEIDRRTGCKEPEVPSFLTRKGWAGMAF